MKNPNEAKQLQKIGVFSKHERIEKQLVTIRIFGKR